MGNLNMIVYGLGNTLIEDDYLRAPRQGILLNQEKKSNKMPYIFAASRINLYLGRMTVT